MIDYTVCLWVIPYKRYKQLMLRGLNYIRHLINLLAHNSHAKFITQSLLMKKNVHYVWIKCQHCYKHFEVRFIQMTSLNHGFFWQLNEYMSPLNQCYLILLLKRHFFHKATFFTDLFLFIFSWYSVDQGVQFTNDIIPLCLVQKIFINVQSFIIQCTICSLCNLCLQQS